MKRLLTNSALRPYAMLAAPIPATDEIRLKALREHLDFKNNTLETMPGLLARTFKHGKYKFFATTL